MSHPSLQMKLGGVVGAGVGAGTGAAPAPTHRNWLMSEGFRSATAPISPRSYRVMSTLDPVRAGFSSSNRATPPDTCGHAIEVPLKERDPESEPDDADTMSLPGAQI
jgi:hypothetical protein